MYSVCLICTILFGQWSKLPEQFPPKPIKWYQGKCSIMASYDIIWQSWQYQLLHTSLSVHKLVTYVIIMTYELYPLLRSPVSFCLHPEVLSLTPTSLSRLQRFCCCPSSWIVASCSCCPSSSFSLFSTRPAGIQQQEKHIMHFNYVSVFQIRFLHGQSLNIVQQNVYRILLLCSKVIARTYLVSKGSLSCHKTWRIYLQMPLVGYFLENDCE